MRSSDDPSTFWTRVRVFWQRIGATLVTCAALGIAAYAVHVAGEANDHAAQAVRLAQAQVTSLVRETRERRDQTCFIQERKQRNDVDALQQTYDFLARAAERHALDDPLNQAILTALPRAVREAQEDDAPPFCKAPGVGLPGPSPKLPKRPKIIPLGPG